MAGLVIAHRGASAAHPENTLEAFTAAAALGADWVELDVHRSRDGVAVVRHDADLPGGTTIGSSLAAELPTTVPTLEAALRACRERGLGVNVEIKSDPRHADHDPAYAVVDATLEQLEVHAALDTGLRSPLLVTSFDPGCLAAVQARSTVATGRLAFDIRDTAALIDRTAADGHVAVNPWDPFVDEAFVIRAHDAGLAVYPWTVDDPERMAVLIALGVDGIITNVPDVLRALLT